MSDKISIREDLVKQGLRFLQHPKVQQTPLSERLAFLEKKGLTPQEIARVLKVHEEQNEIKASKAVESVTSAQEGERLKNRIGVIVGGNAGLGQIIAIRLVKEEAKLVLLEEKKTNRKNTKSTMELLPNQKDQVKLMEINSYTEKDLQESYATIVKDMGRIDFVVNCIPFNGTQNKQLIDISQQEWDEAMGIAARSVFLSCKYAIQQMLTQDNGEVRGRIVNVSSLYGMIARKGHFSYGVTKSTIVHLTRQIAAEYASQGIICNAVAPGFIDDIISKEDCIPPISHDRIPTGTPGKAMDVANAVVFLTSDETKYIQGINLLVDGGALAT